MIVETFDYREYLAIKQAIDDRSLNQSVWQAMAAWLKPQTCTSEFRILEIGAGTGAMILRLLDSGLLDRCQYFAVELEPGFARVAENELSAWAGAHGYSMQVIGPSSWWTLKKDDKVIEIQWITANILEITSDFDFGYFDLLMGHAVIDLLPVPVCMPELLNLVKPGGGYYFSLNFAGMTSFSPSDPRDPEISAVYHRDMDTRFPGLEWRASQTGKGLGRWLKGQGHLVLDEGDSDWQISTEPTPSAAANRFIGYILDTMAKALAGLDGLDDWLNLRRQQADSGNLLFFAGNRDYFGRTDLMDAPQSKESDKKNDDIT